MDTIITYATEKEAKRRAKKLKSQGQITVVKHWNFQGIVNWMLVINDDFEKVDKYKDIFI